MKAEINETENRKTIEKINKTKSWFLKREAKLKTFSSTKKKRRSNKIINERGEITTNVTETQRFIRNYYQQLYQQVE